MKKGKKTAVIIAALVLLTAGAVFVMWRNRIPKHYENEPFYTAPVEKAEIPSSLEPVPCDDSAVKEDDITVSQAVNVKVTEDRDVILTFADKSTVNIGNIGGEDIPNTFVVAFIDYDNSLIKAELVQKGGNATPPAAPYHTGLDFLRWEGEWENVKKDTVVLATYTSRELYCTVSYCTDDGTILCTEKVAMNTASKGVAPPAREGFIFAGWGIPLGRVLKDVSLTASYVAEDSPRFAVSSAEVKAGETAEITVDAVNCPGMSGCSVRIEADDILALESVLFSSSLGGTSVGPQSLPAFGAAKFNWINIEKEMSGDFRLLTLTYSVSKDTPPGDYWIALCCDTGDAVNNREENLPMASVWGHITVKE